MRQVRFLLFVLAIVGLASCSDDAHEIMDATETDITLNNGNGNGEGSDDPIPPGCGC